MMYNLCDNRDASSSSAACRVQEPFVCLGHFLRFIECASALFFKAPEVRLRVSQVELEVLSYENCIVFRRVRISWNKGAVRRDTGGRSGRRVQKESEQYSEGPTRMGLADATESPYFLDHRHAGSLFVL
ncbi:hypothetical protein ATO2_16670 [Roseovarius sp. 22II1-1F6A]|nr:hypothetical protein ATO2_16670 [Roseovarius sp. 22II1-1F6A]